MANGSDALAMLRPDGGWVIYGNDFDSIIYDEGVKPVTKSEFDLALVQADKWLADQETAKATKRAELLARLGISEEEARLLLG